MVLEQPLAQIWMLWVFEKVTFQLFASFLSDKVETIFWESEAKRSNLFKSKLITGNFLENGFGATLSSKTYILSIWKGHFKFLWKFLTD